MISKNLHGVSVLGNELSLNDGILSEILKIQLEVFSNWFNVRFCLFTNRTHLNTNASLVHLRDMFPINPSPESLEHHFQLNLSWLPIFSVYLRSVSNFIIFFFFIVCIFFSVACIFNWLLMLYCCSDNLT